MISVSSGRQYIQRALPHNPAPNADARTGWLHVMSHSPDSRRDVALVHVASLPESLFHDFRDAVSDDDLTLVIESREDTPYAGLQGSLLLKLAG